MSITFCTACGHAVEHLIPEGDNRARAVCPSCGTIQYVNPKMVVGCIPEAEDGRILMCRRNIEPRLGKWTFPAGFLEVGETSDEGAARETLEEALADVEITGLLCLLDIPQVHQMYLVYRARLRPGSGFGPTHESSEVRLMEEAEIPWEGLAFPTIVTALELFFEDRRHGRREVHHQVIRRSAWKRLPLQ